jgi:hypothetical protein
LTRAQKVSSLSAIGPETHVVAVWTLERIAHLAVPNPRLIIPPPITNFQLIMPSRALQPGLLSVVDLEARCCGSRELYIHVVESLCEFLAASEATTHYPCRSHRQRPLPGVQLVISSFVLERCVALFESSPILPEIMVVCRSQQKHKAVKQRATFSGRTRHQLSVGAGHREYRRYLQIISHRNLASIDRDMAFRRGPHLHHQTQDVGRRRAHHARANGVARGSVTGQPSRVRGPE